MKKYLSNFMVVVLLLGLIPSLQVKEVKAATDPDEIVTVMVEFENHKDLKEKKEEVIKVGKLKKEYKSMPVLRLELPYKAAEALKNIDKIKRFDVYTEENTPIHTPSAYVYPEFPFYMDMVNTQHTAPTLARVEVERAWAAGLTGEGVNVGIVDIGFTTHEDLDGRLFYNDMYYQQTVDTNNLYHHGYMTAGIIAARDNGKGLKGIAPNATIQIFDVGRNDGLMDHFAMIDSYDLAWEMRLDVLNVSSNSTTWDHYSNTALGRLDAIGCTVVASAGNYGDDTNIVPSYPADYLMVNGVSAVNDAKTLVTQDVYGWSSNYGTNVLVADGIDVWTTQGFNKYTPKGSGTSMASPIVAGLAALHKEFIKTQEFGDVSTVIGNLVADAEDLGTAGKDEYYGYGYAKAPNITHKDNMVSVPYPNSDYKNMADVNRDGVVTQKDMDDLVAYMNNSGTARQDHPWYKFKYFNFVDSGAIGNAAYLYDLNIDGKLDWNDTNIVQKVLEAHPNYVLWNLPTNLLIQN